MQKATLPDGMPYSHTHTTDDPPFEGRQATRSWKHATRGSILSVTEAALRTRFLMHRQAVFTLPETL